LAIVRVEPLGADIDVRPGEAVAEAAWRLGYHWPTTCFGQANCMQCRVRIVAGEQFVVPADDEESEAMQTWLPAPARKPGIRLGCRLTVIADGVTVEKRDVRPPETVA
jgi:ferredoxin, 2Fe-2S